MNKKKTAKKKTARKTVTKPKLIGEVIQPSVRTSAACLEKGEVLLGVENRQVPIIGTFKIPKPKRKPNPDKTPCCQKNNKPPSLKILDIRASAGSGRLSTLAVTVRASHACGISVVSAKIALVDVQSGEERLGSFMVDGKDAEADMRFDCNAPSLQVEGTLEIPAKGLAGQEFRVFVIAFNCCGKAVDVLSDINIVI